MQQKSQRMKKKKETCNVNEEEKKENIAAPVEQEYSPKRSKTSFKRGGESPKKEAAGNGLIEGITVIKTMDYKYMEILCKVLEGGVNDVGQGYCQKIISAFLAKKPMEVVFINFYCFFSFLYFFNLGVNFC